MLVKPFSSRKRCILEAVTHQTNIHRMIGVKVRRHKGMFEAIPMDEAIDSGRINRYPGKDGQDMSYRING